MAKIKIILSILTFTLLFIKVDLSYCQSTGCQLGSSVYIQQSLGVWYGTPLATACGPSATASTLYAANVRPSSVIPRPCNIRLFQSGTLVNYDTVNCTIDNYVWFFTIILLPFAVWKIRRFNKSA